MPTDYPCSTPKLTNSELREGCQLAQKLLIAALDELRTTMREEIRLLDHEIRTVEETVMSADTDLASMQDKGLESMKGDICTMILRKWKAEEQKERIEER